MSVLFQKNRKGQHRSASGESKISQFKETILRLDFSGLILNGEFSDHRGTSGFHHEKITSQPGAGSDKDVAPGKPNRCPRPSWRRGLPSRTRRMMHAGRFLRLVPFRDRTQHVVSYSTLQWSPVTTKQTPPLQVFDG